MRAGRSADSMGDSRAMRSYGNAQSGIRGVRQETDRANSSLGIFRSRWMLITAAVFAAAPAITRAGGAIVQMTASLVRAAGGAGVIGGGALGIFLTGMLSVVAVAKPMMSHVQQASKAFEAYSKAVEMYGVKSRQAATSARALNQALKEAPANTLRFLTGLEQLENQWRRLTRPGQGSLMGFLAFGVGRIQNAAPQLAGIANRNVSALTAGGRGFIDRILGPSTLADVAAISRYFRQMVPDMAAIAGDAVTIALRLTRDAGPYVRQITHDLREWVDKFDRSTQDTVYMDDRFRRWTSEFRTWLALLRGTENLLSALLGSATGGQREIAGITAHFNLWAEWIRTNPMKMQRFWQESTRFAKGFGNLLVWTAKLLFTLSAALTPVGQALTEIFKAIGPTFLDTLRQLGILATTVFGGIGGFNGPLAVFLGVVNSILSGVNTLIARIPGLGAVIGGAFVVWGVIQFATWIGTATGRMLGLAAATNAQAAAMERLGWASAGGGIGGRGGGGAGGGGGLPILVPTGGGGLRSRLSRLRSGTPGEIIGRTPAGAFIGTAPRAAALSATGAARFAGGALRGIGKFAWPLALGLGAIDAFTTQRSGGFWNQAAQTGAGIAHGATLGLTPLISTPGMRADAQTNRILHGYTQHVHGPNDNISWTNALTMGLAGSDGSRAVRHAGLDQQLAALGGANPRTVAQMTGQIAAYTSALGRLRGVAGATAAQFRNEANANLAILRTGRSQLRSAHGHADFMSAANFLPLVGGAYNIVNAKSGPVAAMDFVIQQSLAKFKTLGPRGRKHLGDALLLWGHEMKDRNPALIGEFNKLRDSALGSVDSRLGHATTGDKAILQGMTETWPKIRDAMANPMEKAAELVSATFTRIQRRAQGSLMAMGYTAAQAMNIIRMMETSGLIPQSMIGPVAPGASSLLPGGGSFGLGTTTGGRASYMRSALRMMGIIPTAGNVSFLTGWAGRENVPQSIDPFNLLGTTLPVGGSHGTNAPGVQAYTSRQSGIKATASMLSQSNFSLIHAALASGDPVGYRSSLSSAQRAELDKEMRAWSGGGYSWPTATPTRKTQSAQPSRTLQGVRVTIGTIHYHGPGDVRHVVANEIKLALQDVEQHMKSMGTSQPEQAHK